VRLREEAGGLTMADADEIAFARAVVRDALAVLHWAASVDGVDAEGRPVVSPALKPFMAEAVEEIRDGAFTHALRILDGEDPDYPPERVSAALDSVGWSGASRAFKERALDEAGRQEVMDAADRGGPEAEGKDLEEILERTQRCARESVGHTRRRTDQGAEGLRRERDVGVSNSLPHLAWPGGG
jgi:hypothetical protein